MAHLPFTQYPSLSQQSPLESQDWPAHGVGFPHSPPWHFSPEQQSPSALQTTPRVPHVERHLKTVMPPEYDVQYGAAEQHELAPQSFPSHEPAGAAHLPFVHERPWQHGVEPLHVPPLCAHVVVFAVHFPPVQRPEQHDDGDVHACPSSLHAGEPVSPHLPPVQRPVQH